MINGMYTFQILSAYLKFMVDIGELLGGDRNETEEQMYKVIELEIQLAKVSDRVGDTASPGKFCLSDYYLNPFAARCDGLIS